MSLDLQMEPRVGSVHSVQLGTSDAEALARAARARSRQAWLILWASFAIFCGVLVFGIAGLSWYRSAAMTTRYATAEIISGTVLLQPQDSVRETVMPNRVQLQDGDRIRTAGDGKAFLSLPDGSTIQMWPETTLQIRQLRTSTYTDERTIMLLTQTAGHTRVEVALPTTHERRFEIQTPNARALMREGNYRVELTPQGTEVSVRAGSASVTALDQTVEVLRHERTIVGSDGQLMTPIDATRNLVRNGDFTSGFEGWRQDSRNEEDGVRGSVSLVQQDGRFAVRMRREDSQKHGETFVHQAINRDVTDDVSLRLNLDAKIVKQELSGGGVLGSEYPLMVRLRYRDAYGSEDSIVRGFYIQNEEMLPTTNGTLLPANQWVPVTIDLFDERVVSTKPAHVLWVEIEASGWEYESLVTGIQLLAE